MKCNDDAKLFKFFVNFPVLIIDKIKFYRKINLFWSEAEYGKEKGCAVKGKGVSPPTLQVQ